MIQFLFVMSHPTIGVAVAAVEDPTYAYEDAAVTTLRVTTVVIRACASCRAAD